ncbi:hypothetical protein OG455_00815 [Kitasatospora sp. NBC_01287]|uniref:lantibiotic dehydratase C-terminal domain-containing protein n=1 Tax=Kitasatospora sp. NBC_01287 TaxID=2903573 RepID=UPI00225152BC|nr:lantibiotic dehydratase C-terminal domain-containing protein [Kitasatospora sp. NBC_01287]MCX4744066.1 hypothetical protein [Kitasatospora sp. NBC_01287]
MLSREPEDHWVSAHVFTAHPLDLVVRRLLPTAVEELRRRGLADHYFFLRHWQRGPHLRLRVRLVEPRAESAARAVLAGHATALFQELPLSRPMTERQYQELAQRFAALEPESEPGTLAANDSLAFVPYRPEHGKYGHGAALRAAEECFATCSELATTAVLADWSPARRLAHCFALLVGSEGSQARPPAEVPPGVAEQYRQRRAALLPVARAARAAALTAAAGGADADPVTRWLAALRRAQDEAQDEAQAQARGGTRGDAGSPDRLAGHLAHLACNRLGVRLDQEATLRGLARLAAAEPAAGAVRAGHQGAGHQGAGHDDAGHDDAGHDDAGHDDAGHDDAGHDD